jgi:hypothetical protein
MAAGALLVASRKISLWWGRWRLERLERLPRDRASEHMLFPKLYLKGHSAVWVRGSDVGLV